MASITKLDYKGCKKRVTDLENHIKSCEELIKQSSKLRKNIDSVWQGESAKAAIEKLEKWENELKKTKDELLKCKNDFNKSVEKINNADKS